MRPTIGRGLRWLCVLAALAAIAPAQSLSVIDPEEVGLSSERLRRIEQVVGEQVAAREIAGAVTLVARRGGIAHFKAHGMSDVEAKRPMRTDTLFRIASMTKPITSVAVMMLYEEGRFLLTDPVSLYLPEFKEMKVLPPEGSPGAAPAPAKRPITIRHLLTHTSGLTYHWNRRLGPALKQAGITHGLIQDEGTLREKMKILATLPLLFHPGERFEYGLSTDVLGCLVEAVSGMSLDEFFRRRIFEPLGMDDTHFFLPEEKVSRLAAVYRRGEGSPIERLPEGPVTEEAGTVYSASYPYQGPKRYFSGGGGLVSTAGDYARFAQMLLNGGELDGVRLLSPKSVELMTMNHVGGLDVDFGFGLGFGVTRDERDLRELGSVGRYGWGGFFYTDFFVDPQEELIGVFMAQLHPSGGLRLHEKFRVLATQAIIE
jgi:CubicO group peptidase (beta-lactamase class C family)